MSTALSNTATAPLPLRALHCLLHAAGEEHCRANLLRRRCDVRGSNKQPRRKRLQLAGALAEARARDLAAQVRA